MRLERGRKHLEKTPKRREEASKCRERLPKGWVTADEQPGMLLKWNERPFTQFERLQRFANHSQACLA